MIPYDASHKSSCNERDLMNAKNFKSRSVIQWNKTPCGSSTLKNKKGTREFFEEVIKYRYKVYAPWLRKIISKEDVKNKKLLEVGCGMGADLLEFAKNGAICTGIDLTPNHVSLAKELFTNAVERRSLGRMGIRAFLGRRGIDKELINETISIHTRDMEMESACRFTKKRLENLKSYPDDVKRRRIRAALYRRGFSAEIIREALNQHIA